VLIAASIVSVILAAGAAPAAPASPAPISRDSQFIPVDRALQRLNAVPTARSIAAWHELLGSEPHIAGTEGDAREIARIRDAFVAMGLSTTVEEFEAPLPQPSEALVEIVGGTDMPQPAPGGRRGVIALPTVERNLAEDPATAHPGLTFGWNAYSASGDVTGGVVYANYGTKADFAKLKEWGIDCTGKVVLCRYGGNFRGYKAKFAEDAGAAALVIFTDPADSGTTKGKVWPEGGWANDTCVQRGSILANEQPGDPTTPFEPSTPGCPRRDMAASGLPRIPVQPVGYAAAAEIVRRMQGKPVPADSAWKGGLPFEYRLDGGDALQVRVKVVQDRALRRTANVVGMIPGAVNPDEYVIIGCHHDAWCFGAADPLAGTIVLMECARSFAEAARAGDRPARTVVFAAWGAEEFGIIGSTEWVEGHRDRLLRGAVAYVNLDMASMGPNFGASCSPSLREAILGATVRVQQARGAANETVYDRMSGGGRKDPQFGELGGGSDHVAFNCHVGVASASFGGGGSEGNSYHSNYDTIAWYRSVVGDDYAPALMVTRMTNALACAMADSAVVPLSAARHGVDGQRLLRRVKERAKDPAMAALIDPLIERAGRAAEMGAQLDAALASAHPWLGTVAANRSARAREACARIDAALISLDRAWLEDAGLEGRPWFRSLLAAADKDSGYAATMLPLLTEAVEAGDIARVRGAVARYQGVFDRLDRGIETARAVVQSMTSADGPPAPLGSR
jgi:N-acetylated-alpha-linked acidic dipeptidase